MYDLYRVAIVALLRFQQDAFLKLLLRIRWRNILKEKKIY